MSSQPVPSALDVRTQAFPILTAAQINRVRPGSKLREVKKGEVLFEPGDTKRNRSRGVDNGSFSTNAGN